MKPRYRYDYGVGLWVIKAGYTVKDKYGRLFPSFFLSNIIRAVH